MSQPYIGEIMMFAGPYTPAGWASCDGQLLPISEHETLWVLLSNTYGGDSEETFGLPNILGRVPIQSGQLQGGSYYELATAGGLERVALTTEQIPLHTHIPRANLDGGGQVSSPKGAYWSKDPTNGVSVYRKIHGGSVATAAMSKVSMGGAGDDRPHSNMQPYVAVSFCLSLFGVFPMRSSVGDRSEPASQTPVSEPGIITNAALGEIRIVSFNFAPKGWAFCNGQLLPVNQNQALFALLGNRFGGDGRTTFALPDLRGRAPAHRDESTIPFGIKAGSETTTLTSAEMPRHAHPVYAINGRATDAVPTGNTWAIVTDHQHPLYAPTADTDMSVVCLTFAGGGKPHENRQPYIALNYIIALNGEFPVRE